MNNRFSRLFALAALAASMSSPATAQEYSNGGNGASGRGPAILTPVEAFGVHPPGVDPADAQRWRSRLRQRYIPYYAPLSPVASTARWQPWAYKPLLPYYTPYYLGYCPHRLFNPPPRRYGSDGWGKGPGPEMPIPDEPGTTPLSFGPYTSVIADDTTYWNMGGNGLVPYGAVPPPAVGPPDLIDAIQSSRPHGHVHKHFHRGASAIDSPVETATGEKGEVPHSGSQSSRRDTKSAEPLPPGEISD